MTVTAFSKTLRALERNRAGALLWWLSATAVLTGAIVIWMVSARVQLDEVSDDARIEIDGSAWVVQAPITGRVIRVSQSLGQSVRAGDVLVEMDSSHEQLQMVQEQSRNEALDPELRALRGEISAETASLEVERSATRAALAEAQARIQETGAPLKLAEQEQARAIELFREHLISRREWEHAISETDRLRSVSKTEVAGITRIETEQSKREKDREIRIAAIQSRIAKLEGDKVTNTTSVRLAQRDLAGRKILAPVSGRIGEAPELAPGSVLREGDRVAAIVPDRGLRIVAQFSPAAAHGRLHAGQHARMRLTGYPWTEFGVVESEVTAVGDEDVNAKVRVELVLRDSPSLRVALRHGMPGSLEVDLERVTPLALLLRQAGQWMSQRKTT